MPQGDVVLSRHDQ